MNNNGNGLEDRVSASSGIASANSSSMPWGLPDVGANIATGQSYGPQVNTYHSQSTSPSGRRLQDGLLDQELRNLTLRNGPECRDGAIATPQLFPYNSSSSHTCDLHSHLGNNPNLITRSRIDPLSSTPSPHFSGLPQIHKNDNSSKPRHFSPSLRNGAQTSQPSYMSNVVSNQSPTVASSTTSQLQSDNFVTNGIGNIRVTDCLTETTDCQSEVSVLTATTTTTAGPLISSRRESTRKSRKGISASEKENISKAVPFQNAKLPNQSGKDIIILRIF